MTRLLRYRLQERAVIPSVKGNDQSEFDAADWQRIDHHDDGADARTGRAIFWNLNAKGHRIRAAVPGQPLDGLVDDDARQRKRKGKTSTPSDGKIQRLCAQPGGGVVEFECG